MTHVSRKKHTEESRPPAPSAFNCSVLALATTRFVPLYNSLCTILCAVSIARIYHLRCFIDRYNDQSSCSLYLYQTIEHPARFLTLLSIALARSSSDAQLAYAILSPQISSKLLTVRVALFAEWGSREPSSCSTRRTEKRRSRGSSLLVRLPAPSGILRTPAEPAPSMPPWMARGKGGPPASL